MQRVKRIFWLCMAMSVVGCGFANLLFVWQDDFFLNFFSTDAVVHEYGAIRLHTVLAFQWLACSYEISGSSLRGMGRSFDTENTIPCNPAGTPIFNILLNSCP